MTTINALAEVEVSQTADELVICGRRKNVVVGVIVASISVPCSLAIAYQNIVGTADVPPIWKRPGGDQLFILAVLLVGLLAFGVGPIALCVMFVRERRRAWVFDRPRGRLTRMDRSWPLSDLTAIVVDVRRGRFTDGSAAAVLHFGESQAVEVKRFHAGGQKAHVPLETCIRAATDLASVVGDFLRVPVQHPPRPNQGFEVVMRAES